MDYSATERLFTSTDAGIVVDQQNEEEELMALLGLKKIKNKNSYSIELLITNTIIQRQLQAIQQLTKCHGALAIHQSSCY